MSSSYVAESALNLHFTEPDPLSLFFKTTLSRAREMGLKAWLLHFEHFGCIRSPLRQSVQELSASNSVPQFLHFHFIGSHPLVNFIVIARQVFIRTSALVIVRMNRLSEEKDKKTAFIIERFIWMFGCTPDERSDENREWMREKGYNIKDRHKRGRWGKRGR